jgi:DNA-directed RNA polymerase specialized sigma24 family protein
MDPSSEAEFLRFVANASPGLLRAAYALTGQQQAAEDLVQTRSSAWHCAGAA